LLTLDYTPALVDDVARRFAAWADKHPRPVAVVVKKKGWKGPEVHGWDWEGLWGGEYGNLGYSLAELCRAQITIGH